MTSRAEKSEHRQLATLSLAALGVVFGDIGTSPLYAVRECFHGPLAVEPTPANILGILSLIFWSLIIIISAKYLLFVMRADNRGEGGILALMALALPTPEARHKRWVLAALGIFGAALLYGDGVITPAISVLSAVEGLEVLSSGFQPWVVPIAITILVGLFYVQSKGTAKVGAVFGPITLLWFLTIGVLGGRELVSTPSVLVAISPHHALLFFARNGLQGFLILGVVFLVVTGGEALYADMGHFGRKPIRLAWFVLVCPSLILSYFGQGALLLRSPEAASNPFFNLASGWLQLPLIVLAMAATVIASQAVISGAFSLAMQAVSLGYSPRLKIVFTSKDHRGQIYVPLINWMLFVATIALVVGFKSSSALAAAYGIAVTTTMGITTLLTYTIARERWKIRRAVAMPLLLFFLATDLAFFGGNIVKIADGGWLPISIAAGAFFLMTTWHSGRRLVAAKLASMVVPLSVFLRDVKDHPPIRVPGVAVFMVGQDDGTPAALLHNLKHNKVLHEKVLLLTIKSVTVPYVEARDRVDHVDLDDGFHRVTAVYGFMEKPDVPEVLKNLQKEGLSVGGLETTFFVGQQQLAFGDHAGLGTWRQGLYLWLMRNARNVTDFFNLPANQVVHIGSILEV